MAATQAGETKVDLATLKEAEEAILSADVMVPRQRALLAEAAASLAKMVFPAAGAAIDVKSPSRDAIDKEIGELSGYAHAAMRVPVGKLVEFVTADGFAFHPWCRPPRTK